MSDSKPVAESIAMKRVRLQQEANVLFDRILKHIRKPAVCKTGNIPYAIAYILAISNHDMRVGSEEFRMQLPYVRGNLQSWKGAEARELKKQLDSLIKETNH